jgi:hypothetical protein
MVTAVKKKTRRNNFALSVVSIDDRYLYHVFYFPFVFRILTIIDDRQSLVFDLTDLHIYQNRSMPDETT